METITIPKAEYERLKKLDKVDHDLIKQFGRYKSGKNKKGSLKFP